MKVHLKKAAEGDLRHIYEMQIRAFTPLLEKYKDHDTNPAAEPFEQTERRFLQNGSAYYLILADDLTVGAMRVRSIGEECRVSPILILPEHQRKGYATAAMTLAEALYPAPRRWALETIAQEEGLCRLYEGLGYEKTGHSEHIKNGMDLVFYEKSL